MLSNHFQPVLISAMITLLIFQLSGFILTVMLHSIRKVMFTNKYVKSVLTVVHIQFCYGV